MTPFIYGFRPVSVSRPSIAGFPGLPAFSAHREKSLADMPSFILLHYCQNVYVNFLS